MLILDASVIAALLTGHPSQDKIAQIMRSDPQLLAPSHMDVEVLSALRGLLLGKRLAMGDLRTAARKLATMPIQRVPVDNEELILETVRWFHNLTAYDAAYLALTSHAKGTLVTGDAGLAKTAQRARLSVQHIDCSQ